MTNGQQPTAAHQWQRPTRLVELPSGKVAEVKAVDLGGLILTAEEGAIPDIITQQMVDEMNGKVSKKKNADQVFSTKDMPGLMSFVNLLVRACMVAPRVVGEGKIPNYDAGEIAIDDIDLTDRMFLFGELMPHEEMATASRFRNGSSAGMAIVSESEDVSADTE